VVGGGAWLEDGEFFAHNRTQNGWSKEVRIHPKLKGAENN
jgi:hypothetical protein